MLQRELKNWPFRHALGLFGLRLTLEGVLIQSEVSRYVNINV